MRAGAPNNCGKHCHFRIPSVLWTEGYIARLGGRRIAMLLVLLCEQHSPGVTCGSPRLTKERFGLPPARLAPNNSATSISSIPA
ncbi:hypothetical protein ACFSTC_38000 [Nonomuraea ferruginea]